MEQLDYVEIAARIRAAERMRSEALGQILASAWQRLKRHIIGTAGDNVGAKRRKMTALPRRS